MGNDFSKKESIQQEESATEDEEASDVQDEQVEYQVYICDDFTGTYVIFAGEAYESLIIGMSEIIVLGEDTFQSL